MERILYHACVASISCGASRISYRVSDISFMREFESSIPFDIIPSHAGAEIERLLLTFSLTFCEDSGILKLAEDISAFEPIVEIIFPSGMSFVFIFPTL